LKLSGLLLLALVILATVNAGCVGFIRDTYRNYISTPVPSPSIMPTVTSTPINQTIERQYMFAEKLMAGLEHYNEGIRTWNASRKDADSANWVNATQGIEMAKAYMEEARLDFLSMKPYAATPDEANLAEKWNETAYYQSQAFDYVNLSYQEGAYQSARSFAEQNPIKYNYYVSQANYYISLAKQSKAEAEDLERRTFIGQQGQVV
jgi:hypothetical protein